MDLARCVPHDEICTSTYCLAQPGEEYLCLLPAGGSEGIGLQDAPGTFAVEWLDPATGEVHAGAEMPGGRRQLLNAPFVGPAVVYLRRREG